MARSWYDCIEASRYLFILDPANEQAPTTHWVLIVCHGLCKLLYLCPPLICSAPLWSRYFQCLLLHMKNLEVGTIVTDMDHIQVSSIIQIWNHHLLVSIFTLKIIFTCLKNQSAWEAGEERPRQQRSCICIFTPQMLATHRAVSGQNQ